MRVSVCMCDTRQAGASRAVPACPRSGVGKAARCTLPLTFVCNLRGRALRRPWLEAVQERAAGRRAASIRGAPLVD